MKSPFWCLFEFLSLTSAAVVSPLVFPNTSESVNTVATQPIIGDPEPSFKLEAYFNGSKLPFVSCLINIVDTLMILGLEDFSGNMEKVTWNFDDYAQVGMVISPIEEGGSIERRFAIWGLSQGAAQMIHLRRFQAVTFTLLCTCLLLFFFTTRTSLETVGLGLFWGVGGGPPYIVPSPVLQTDSELSFLPGISNADGKNYS